MAAALALPERLDAMHLFGEVHQIEVDGEGGGHGSRGVVRECSDLGRQTLAGTLVVEPPCLGQRADALLGLEEGWRLLGPDDVTEDLAQQMDGCREVHHYTTDSVRAVESAVHVDALARDVARLGRA